MILAIVLVSMYSITIEDHLVLVVLGVTMLVCWAVSRNKDLATLLR